MILPVILCGGSGTRLWPLSRRLYPKQFHNLHGGDSLLQQTAERARRVCGAPDLIVVTNEEQKFLVADQLGSIAGLNVLIEPMPRNTAPVPRVAETHGGQLSQRGISWQIPCSAVFRARKIQL